MTPAVWRNRDYMLLWSGQVVSTTGSMASYAVIPLLILALTDSPAAAGTAAALRWLPYMLFSLPGGALIDRWDRKRVMIIADLGRALAIGSLPAAMFFGGLTVAQIYVVSFIEGTLFVFFNLAEVAALPHVVARGELPEATALNEAGFGTAHIVGPPIGTFLYQTLGRAVPLAIDALSYLVSVVSLVMIRAEFRSEARPEHRDLRKEVMDGLHWLWGKPLIRYMAFLTGGYNLVNGAAPLVIIVLAKQLGSSDAEIGVMFSMGGVGAIVGSLIGGRIQKRFTFGQVIVTLAWLNVAAMALFTLVPSPIGVGIVTGVIFFFGPIYNVVQFSYRIALIPDGLQGRVNSVFRLLAFGFIPVGAAAGGAIIEGIGVIPCIVALTAWSVVLAVTATFNRHVREAAPIDKMSK